ncbi:MAG: HAD hydrolase-like protein [Candidatus Micrarchaeaceae archaeon]
MESSRFNVDDYDLFLFDWDGTLCVEPFLLKLNKVLNPSWRLKKMRANEEATQKSALLRNGDAAKHIYKRGAFEEINEIETEIEARMADISISLFKPRLREGAKMVLEKLSKRRKYIALITDGALYRIYREVEKLGVLNYFEALLSLQTIGKLKPNPLGAELMIKALKAEKKKTIYIGDMVDDILFARYAGIDICTIAGGFQSFNTLKRYKPKFIYRNMMEFEKSIK